MIKIDCDQNSPPRGIFRVSWRTSHYVDHTHNLAKSVTSEGTSPSHHPRRAIYGCNALGFLGVLTDLCKVYGTRPARRPGGSVHSLPPHANSAGSCGVGMVE